MPIAQERRHESEGCRFESWCQQNIFFLDTYVKVSLNDRPSCCSIYALNMREMSNVLIVSCVVHVAGEP